MYGSAVAVGAIGRGFLRVDRVERLQQRPIAKIVWIRRERCADFSGLRAAPFYIRIKPVKQRVTR